MAEEKTLYINFFAGINGRSIQKLISVIHRNLQRDVKKIYLAISSPGGEVPGGLSAYNFLRGLGVDVTTHNYGIIHSMAIVLFCAGTKRYSVSNARFLLHSVSSRSRGDERAIKAALESLENYRDNIASVIADNCDKNREEIKELMFQGSTWDIEKALKHKLVHELKEKLPFLEDNVELITDEAPQTLSPRMRG